MENHLATPENLDVENMSDKKRITHGNNADDDSVSDETKPIQNGFSDTNSDDDEENVRRKRFIKSQSQPADFAPGTEPDTDNEGDVIPVTYVSNHERPKSDSDIPFPTSPDLPSPPPLLPPPLSAALPPPPPPPSQPNKKPPSTLRRRMRSIRMSRSQKETVKRHAKNATKQFVIFLVSHVGLTCVVVAYSIMGGFIFQTLEASNEKESRTHIQEIRERHVKDLWNVTQELNIFDPDKWHQVAEGVLKDFQSEMYEAVKDKAWDGTDNVTAADLQWTYAGSLLYSVTVITTIGYGNLTPKTVLGRVVTMLYAVIGIPMTLLCLTNIGSFMARCFRILWKQIVCKPCRNHIRRRSMYRAAKQKAATAAYVASLAKQKRGVANTGGVAMEKAGTEGGRGYDEGASDSPAAVHDGTSLLGKGGGANSSPLPSGDSRYLLGFEGLTAGESVSSELHKKGPPSDSSDRTVIPLTESHHSSIPFSARPDHQQQHAREETEKAQATDAENPEITITATNPCSDPDLVHENDDMQRALKPTISVSSQPEVVRVPIMVCLIMVAAYIILGAVLFSLWEDWSYFDSSYFCFITLSTIGFGDIVPGFEHDSWGNQAKRVSCTLYLLFGLALLAMCFELIQSECRQKFLTLARAMGLNGDGRP